MWLSPGAAEMVPGWAHSGEVYLLAALGPHVLAEPRPPLASGASLAGGRMTVVFTLRPPCVRVCVQIPPFTGTQSYWNGTTLR